MEFCSWHFSAPSARGLHSFPSYRGVGATTSIVLQNPADSIIIGQEAASLPPFSPPTRQRVGSILWLTTPSSCRLVLPCSPDRSHLRRQGAAGGRRQRLAFRPARGDQDHLVSFGCLRLLLFLPASTIWLTGGGCHLRQHPPDPVGWAAPAPLAHQPRDARITGRISL